MALEVAGYEVVRCEWCASEFRRGLRGLGANGGGNRKRFCSRYCLQLAYKQRRRSFGPCGLGPDWAWDTVEPGQTENGQTNPERELLVAILERAVLDLDMTEKGRSIHATRSVEFADDARKWFRSRSEEPFSFRWVARHLEIEPEWFLRKISEGKKRRRPQPGGMAFYGSLEAA